MCEATDKMQRASDANPGAELAREPEIDILLDQRLFELDADTFDALATALDHPTPAGPTLKALMKRRPSWQE
jgi:uncharacterized protein (DUF1778 family)